MAARLGFSSGWSTADLLWPFQQAPNYELSTEIDLMKPIIAVGSPVPLKAPRQNYCLWHKNQSVPSASKSCRERRSAWMSCGNMIGSARKGSVCPAAARARPAPCQG